MERFRILITNVSFSSPTNEWSHSSHWITRPKSVVLSLLPLIFASSLLLQWTHHHNWFDQWVSNIKIFEVLDVLQSTIIHFFLPQLLLFLKKAMSSSQAPSQTLHLRTEQQPTHALLTPQECSLYRSKHLSQPWKVSILLGGDNFRSQWPPIKQSELIHRHKCTDITVFLTEETKKQYNSWQSSSIHFPIHSS